ncbi:DUF262 domain-containing protein [Methylorubrum populi]|uniref:DUF262 domain-containing protein n=1 Tax=Methylorubrum populi TaxID=223967 RepID=UPI003F657F40
MADAEFDASSLPPLEQGPKKSTKNSAEIEAAEAQVVSNIRDVRYVVREYPTEVVVEKYLTGAGDDTNEIYVPDYQRDLVWPERNQSRFIESILIGLPIPFLFVADVSDEEDPDRAGRLEIVDGVQRIRTLARFMTGDLVLNGLDRLNLLNGFAFYDLHPSRQRRFKRATLRLIELTESVTEDVRRDMFDRINSGAVGLEAVEVRRGVEQGPFVDLIGQLAKDPALRDLAPISEPLERRFEYEELATRFFAFLNRYQNYGLGDEGKVVSQFLLSYVRRVNEELRSADGAQIAAAMTAEWQRMLQFVKAHYPEGFRKSGRGRKVPRVRFEALAVGTALALRQKPDLVPKNVDWLESAEFKKRTTSDAANNRPNLVGRIEFVRDKLLEA